LLEAGFRLGHIRDSLPQQEFTLEPIGLRQHITMALAYARSTCTWSWAPPTVSCSQACVCGQVACGS
jgi:hypothetical protein